MPTYSSSQRASIAQFTSFTQAKESIAARFLKSNDWNVERALDAFYQNGSTNSVPSVQAGLNKVFDHYRENPKESPDKIGIDGVQAYLTDLNVELDDVVHLAICELVQCASIGEFERAGFITGWRSISGDKAYDNIARQSQHVDTLRKKLLNDPDYFRQVYRNTFKLAKPENQRSLPVESAVEFWRMFFSAGKGGIEWNTSSTKWLDLWIDHYEKNNGRPVNKDLWNMVGEFVMKTRQPGAESLDWWSEDGAWPMAVDDFVRVLKSKRKTDGDAMDTS